MELDIRIAGTKIPVVRHPKVLGVTLDPGLFFHKHAEAVKVKQKSFNNVLKQLAGTNWGLDKEVLVNTYKAGGKPIADYAAPIWAPFISAKRWEEIQVPQNAALRIATGNARMAPIEHLHQECKILPVKPHVELLCKQYQLRCHLPSHPSHGFTRREPPPRKLRTGCEKFDPEIAQVLPAAGLDLDPEGYRAGLATLHRQAVDDAVRGYKPNVVLGGYPPPISDSEKSLSREARCVLSQMRSGWCMRLNSYRHRIDPGIPDCCPNCGIGPDDVSHVFNCAARSAGDLHERDLWDDPVGVARFLGLQ
jgi:hypothetical protein